jgi:hypothetical protein
MNTTHADLQNLTLDELYAVLKHVTQHKEHAIILADKMAEENATWLIQQVRKELRSRL